jgi:hypothetical protein
MEGKHWQPNYPKRREDRPNHLPPVVFLPRSKKSRSEAEHNERMAEGEIAETPVDQAGRGKWLHPATEITARNTEKRCGS